MSAKRKHIRRKKLRPLEPRHKMDYQCNLNITREQFYEGIKRQYAPGLEAIKSDEELRSTVRRFGVDPDEMAKEIEAELKQLEAITFRKTI